MDTVLSLANALGTMSRDDYIKTNQQMCPVLIQLSGTIASPAQRVAFETWTGLDPETQLTSKSYDPSEMEVYPLTKRVNADGELVNPFGMFVSLGRAKNNDLSCDSPLVSKVHAYFHKHPEGGFQVQDRSKNGTNLIVPSGEIINLIKDEKYDLTLDGTILQMAGPAGVRLVYFASPAQFYDFLQDTRTPINT